MVARWTLLLATMPMRFIPSCFIGLIAALISAGADEIGVTNRLAGAEGTPVIRSWGTTDGLPQNMISAIAQSRDGYLWLGTGEGLVRFDGVRFTIYGMDHGLESADVRNILEDRNGVLWLITADGRVGRWQNERMEPVGRGDPKSSEETALYLAEDAEGHIWVGMQNGVRMVQGDQLVTIPALEYLDHTPIRSLQCDDQSTMWIGTVSEGLHAFRDGQHMICPGPPSNEVVYAHCILNDRQGRLWVSVGNGKVLCRRDEQWRVYTQADGLPFPFITSLAEDADGTIWAGSLDEGLYRFDGQRFWAIRKADGLSADDVRSLRADREGNLWVGTRTGGLNRLSRRKLLVVGSAQGLTNDFTRGIAEMADGTLWVGTTGGGLYQGGPTGFTAFRPNSTLSFYVHVESVLAASDGSLWWGGNNSLLRWKNSQLTGAFTNGFWVRGKAITALQEDGTGGLWIGNSVGEMIHYRDGTFKIFPRRVSQRSITALAVQPDGEVWVGSIAGGVKRIKEGSDQVFSLNRGLVSQSIRTLYLDREGMLWIGTAGGGLACSRNGQIVTFSPGQGITPRTVSQIIEDDQGFLWLGCNRGVFKVRKLDLLNCAAGKLAFVHMRSYGVNDGMFAEECTGGFCPAGLKTRSGLICFSTVKGLVFFDPEMCADESPPSPALIEEVLVNGQPRPVLFRETDTSSGPAANRLTLQPGERDIEIDYTAIQFSAPEKIGFRYRLVGMDNGWMEAGGRRTAYYQRLTPGEYTFEVQACNANGLWQEQSSKLGVTVMPFYWETASFRAATMLLLIGLGGGTLWWWLRRRYHRRINRLQMIHAVERERLRISKDMHDHVGGMLTQVSQLSDMALGETELQTLVQARLTRIGQQARGAVQALDEIVWATNPKNDNLASFAEYVSRFGDEFFESTNIRCWQEVPTTLPALPLRADIRHNVFLAVREACNNVLKHSHADEVWLRLDLDGDLGRIEVEDNGYGFDPKQVSGTGNGLNNLHTRLAEEGGRAEITSTFGKGTIVRLLFPLKS